MLRKTIDNLEGLSPEVQKFYEPSEGKFRLKLEDDDEKVLKTKLSEFRDNNIKILKEKETMQKQMEELSKKLESIDVEEYRTLKEQKDKLVDDDLKKKGNVDEIVEQRTKRMKTDLENQVKALQTKIAESEQSKANTMAEFKKVKIDNEIQLQVAGVGTLQKDALVDVLYRGRALFHLDDNHEVVALDAKGGIIPGKDGVTPLTIKEWAASLPNELPHLFIGSEGIAAKGSSNGQRNRTINFSKISDPTERMKLMRRAGG
jgi:hypothetical protein